MTRLILNISIIQKIFLEATLELKPKTKNKLYNKALLAFQGGGGLFKGGEKMV
jgi:hypothetical protein